MLFAFETENGDYYLGAVYKLLTIIVIIYIFRVLCDFRYIVSTCEQ